MTVIGHDDKPVQMIGMYGLQTVQQINRFFRERWIRKIGL